MRWTVTPVIRSPRRNVQNTGSGPRPAGRSEGWTLRIPSGGVSRASRGSRQRKQAATATWGAMLRIASVASTADFTQTTGMPAAAATRWISSSRVLGCRARTTAGIANPASISAVRGGIDVVHDCPRKSTLVIGVMVGTLEHP